MKTRPSRLRTYCYFIVFGIFFTGCVNRVLESNTPSVFPYLDLSEIAAKKDTTLSSHIELTVKAIDHIVEIYIQTTDESEMSGFQLEKAIGDEPFRSINRETVFGDSLGSTYVLIDKEIELNKPMVYREKIFDRKGGIKYSDKATVFTKKVIKDVVFMTDSVMPSQLVAIEALTSGKAELTVFDANGKPVLARNIYLKKGKNWSNIDLWNVKNGIYLIDVTAEGVHFVHKVVKYT